MNRENKRRQYEKGYYKTHPCGDAFTCRACGRLVTPENAGSDHRNHCPNCLCSSPWNCLWNCLCNCIWNRLWNRPWNRPWNCLCNCLCSCTDRLRNRPGPVFRLRPLPSRTQRPPRSRRIRKIPLKRPCTRHSQRLHHQNSARRTTEQRQDHALQRPDRIDSARGQLPRSHGRTQGCRSQGPPRGDNDRSSRCLFPFRLCGRRDGRKGPYPE